MQLGEKVAIPNSPEEAKIEVVNNKSCETMFVARFIVPEFTSLCPVTGQPDFAKICIDYCPSDHLIESKSLKLFMGSFRNHGAFHEQCTVTIFERLMEAAEPDWMRVVGIWYPRGGIPIDVSVQSGAEPEGIFVLPIPFLIDYNGRG